LRANQLQGFSLQKTDISLVLIQVLRFQVSLSLTLPTLGSDDDDDYDDDFLLLYDFNHRTRN
jgi:hypothetical protein